MEMVKRSITFQCNKRLARKFWGHIPPAALYVLRELTSEYLLSIASGDLILLDGRWYVTHNGLLGLARRNRCVGINVRPAPTFSAVCSRGSPPAQMSRSSG